MRAASRPSGWARMAASTASAACGRTPITALPSLAITSGSMPSRSDAPRTSGRTGTAASSMRMPTFDFCAISWSALERPPRVGSFIATTPSPPAPSAARMTPLMGATSERRSPSSDSACRAAMMAMPWSPTVPVTMSTSPGARPESGTGRSQNADPRRVQDEPVNLAAAHHFRVAGHNRRARFLARGAD